MFEPYIAPIKAAVWERDGVTVRATAHVPVELDLVKFQMTEWNGKSQSISNLYRIVNAMQRYHDKNGRYPPAVVTDADGKPLYSWRVLLLPYMNGEATYKRFHLNRAWDHPSNLPLLDQMPAAFAAPGLKPGATTTHYQVLTGPGGMFDAPDGRKQTEIPDGNAFTFLIVESPDAVPWTKPADVAFNPNRVPKLGGVVASGFNAAMANGSVRFFRHGKATPAMLRGLFTRAGGEKIALP